MEPQRLLRFSPVKGQRGAARFQKALQLQLQHDVAVQQKRPGPVWQVVDVGLS